MKRDTRSALSLPLPSRFPGIHFLLAFMGFLIQHHDHTLPQARCESGAALPVCWWPVTPSPCISDIPALVSPSRLTADRYEPRSPNTRITDISPAQPSGLRKGSWRGLVRAVTTSSGRTALASDGLERETACLLPARSCSSAVPCGPSLPPPALKRAGGC